jgi:nitrogen regulatory protein P-II 1
VKKITAIIRPECLDTVNEALKALGVAGITVSDVLGRGKHGGIKFVSRGKAYTVTLLHKVQIMILTEESEVDSIIQTIIEKSRTERGYGDGKIFVEPVEKVITISTGETK